MTSSVVVTTSSTGTTFGWWTLDAMRASSRNIATNSGSSANSGMQPLRRDDAREALVAHEPRDVDRRHAAARDLPMQQVATDGDLAFIGLFVHGYPS